MWLVIAIIHKSAFVQVGMDPQAENATEAINTGQSHLPLCRPKLCLDSEDLASVFLECMYNSSLIRPDQLRTGVCPAQIAKQLSAQESGCEQ